MSEPFAAARPLAGDEVPPSVSAFVPILILGLVMLVWFVFQATQLRLERSAMQATFTAQEKPMGDAKKLRDSLEAIARGTLQLADAGNPGAKLIVDELGKRGVTIGPRSPAASGAPATTTK